VPVEVGVEHERAVVDHRHRRVEVHHGPGSRQLHGDDRVRLATLEQGTGEDLGAHRGRPLPHPDHDDPAAEHVHVTALDRRGQVVLVIVAVVGGEVRHGEHRVVAVDGPAVERLALAGGLGHRVDRDPAVNPAGVVPLEQVVGQRRQQEVVGAQHVPLQAPWALRVQVGLEHPAYQELGQRSPVEVLEEPAQRAG
jgi:hypothetical protein